MKTLSTLQRLWFYRGLTLLVTAVLVHLLAVWAAGASLVQLTNPDPDALERRRATEKVTRG